MGSPLSSVSSGANFTVSLMTAAGTLVAHLSLGDSAVIRHLFAEQKQVQQSVKMQDFFFFKLSGIHLLYSSLDHIKSLDFIC